MGVEKDELRRTLREERIQRSREALMYIARRYSEASLGEIVGLLGVKDMSTVSHGIRRAEGRLGDEEGFRRQVNEVLKRLSHSCIQA